MESHQWNNVKFIHGTKIKEVSGVGVKVQQGGGVRWDFYSELIFQVYKFFN